MRQNTRKYDTFKDILLEHIPTAVAILDQEMCYLWTSKRWLTDYNLTEKDVIGHSHYEVFPTLAIAGSKFIQLVLQEKFKNARKIGFLNQMVF